MFLGVILFFEIHLVILIGMKALSAHNILFLY
jgi:hypothetical protein